MNCSVPGSGSTNTAFGPCWSAAFNNGCPFDDPSITGLGPEDRPESAATETQARGFGFALGLNEAPPGSGASYIQMFVR